MDGAPEHLGMRVGRRAERPPGWKRRRRHCERRCAGYQAAVRTASELAATGA